MFQTTNHLSEMSFFSYRLDTQLGCPSQLGSINGSINGILIGLLLLGKLEPETIDFPVTLW